MLLPEPRDRPLFIALLAIAFALGLNFVFSTTGHSCGKHPNGDSDCPRDAPAWSWEAAEAVATITIASLAILQWRDSSRSSERQSRAYVSIGPHPQFVAPDFDAEQLVIWLTAKNWGQTPAYNVRSVVNVAVFSKNASPPDRSHLLPKSGGPIGPGAELYLRGARRKLSDSEKTALISGDSIIGVYGVVKYRDAFNIERYSKFRMMITVDPNGNTHGLEVVTDGNECS